MTLKVETQLAVFMDNRPGMLARTCEALSKRQINMLALSILDTVDFAVVRIVVDKAKEAEEVLSQLHAMVQAHDVILMDLPDEPGALAQVAERLTGAGINIEYAYCTGSGGGRPAKLVLRTNDLEETISTLS